MELNIEKVTVPAKIVWNREEVKKAVAEATERYKALVYNDDQMKEAKKDRAMLVKAAGGIKSGRLTVKRQLLEPYEVFSAETDEVLKDINEAVSNIDAQVKAFTDREKQEKLNAIKEVYEDICPYDWLTLDQIYDKTWLNKTKKIEAVKLEMVEKLNAIHKDVDLIGATFPADSIEYASAKAYYINNGLSIGDAIKYGHDVKAAKEAQERAKQEQQRQPEPEPEVIARGDQEKEITPDTTPEETPVQPEIKTYRYTVLIDAPEDKLSVLNTLFPKLKPEGITYKIIKKEEI